MTNEELIRARREITIEEALRAIHAAQPLEVFAHIVVRDILNELYLTGFKQGCDYTLEEAQRRLAHHG